MSAGGWLCAGVPAPASRACAPLEVLGWAGGAGLTKTYSKKITALDSCLKNKLGPRGLKSKLSQSVHREGCRLTEESDVQVAVGAVGTLFSSVTFPQSFKRSSQNPPFVGAAHQEFKNTLIKVIS